MRDFEQPTIEKTRITHELCRNCNEYPKPTMYNFSRLGLGDTWKCRCGNVHRVHPIPIYANEHAYGLPSREIPYEKKLAHLLREDR